MIPARQSSKGIPGKNFRPLSPGGHSAAELALRCAFEAGCDPVVYSSDWPVPSSVGPRLVAIDRPRWLAQDDTPMMAVVQHALAQVPGPPEQIVVLLQPTQPLRQPHHVRLAIETLEASGADSVVSVVPLEATHNPDLVLAFDRHRLVDWQTGGPPTSIRRQDVRPGYLRDGTVYAFRRSTVLTHGSIYGLYVQPLVIPRSESCPLDTPDDWLEAERRLRALSAV